MSTTQTTHTQTPWAIDSELPPNARSIIARVGGIGISGNTEGPHEETDYANAAHIVRCVNAHDELVRALNAAEFELRQAWLYKGYGVGPLQAPACAHALHLASDALAKAEQVPS